MGYHKQGEQIKLEVVSKMACEGVGYTRSKENINYYIKHIKGQVLTCNLFFIFLIFLDNVMPSNLFTFYFVRIIGSSH